MPLHDFNSAVELNRQRIARFQKIEPRSWGAEGAMMELTKQVGDLAALVMTKEGYYFKGRELHSDKYSVDPAAIADELADILFAIMRVAQHYDLNIAEATFRANEGDIQWFKDKDISF